jgi:sugar-specific transcriptional regulator TrmB
LKTSELIEKLKALGFKEYEAKVFVVMLKGSSMTASEIAAEAKIIRNSIYDILKSFVDKGYCNEIETNTVLRYQIIDPRVILDKIIRDRNKSHKEEMDSLNNAFSEVQSIYGKQVEKQDESDTNIQLLRGFNKHRVEKYIELLKKFHKGSIGNVQAERPCNRRA